MRPFTVALCTVPPTPMACDFEASTSVSNLCIRGCIYVSPAPVSTAMRSMMPSCLSNISSKHRSGSSGHEQAAAQACVSDEEKQLSPKQILRVLVKIILSMAARNTFSGSKSCVRFSSHISMACTSVSCCAISSSSVAAPKLKPGCDTPPLVESVP